MSEKLNTGDKRSGFLFTVDVMIEAQTNGQALEKLLRILNEGEIIDYRVVKGINLGTLIASALEQSSGKAVEIKITPDNAGQKESAAGKKPGKSKPETKPAAEDGSEHREIIEQIEKYKNNQTLVRLTIVKGKGVKLSVPCRILNYDRSTEMITVYHVDEKKVYSYQLYEIDDLTTV